MYLNDVTIRVGVNYFSPPPKPLQLFTELFHILCTWGSELVFTNAVNENEAMINGDACDTDHCANDQYA